MSRVYHSQNPEHVFQSRTEIEEHLLSKTANAGQKVGTERELFVTTPEGLPPTFDQIEMIFSSIAGKFAGAKGLHEKGRIVGLHLPDTGDVSLEPGGQVELSTKPCDGMDMLADINRKMFEALQAAAVEQDLRVIGAGHMPSFLKAEDMPRSRFHAYYAYCYAQYGERAKDLIDTMKSACGLQVNVDPMGEDFHKIYRALLLLDVAQSLSQRTERQRRLHENYAVLSPEQLTPVFESLSARSNEELIVHVVDRLLTLKVPFVPDAASAEGFRSTLDIFGHAPTVGELMRKKLLTTEILDNALSLQLTMPNMRRHGVLETRAPDSPATTEELLQTAGLYYGIAYNKLARGRLLEKFEGIDPENLRIAYLTRFEQTEAGLKSFDLGGGMKVSDLTGFFDAHLPQSRPVIQPRNVASKRKIN